MINEDEELSEFDKKIMAWFNKWDPVIQVIVWIAALICVGYIGLQIVRYLIG